MKLLFNDFLSASDTLILLVSSGIVFNSGWTNYTWSWLDQEEQTGRIQSVSSHSKWNVDTVWTCNRQETGCVFQLLQISTLNANLYWKHCDSLKNRNSFATADRVFISAVRDGNVSLQHLDEKCVFMCKMKLCNVQTGNLLFTFISCVFNAQFSFTLLLYSHECWFDALFHLFIIFSSFTLMFCSYVCSS